MALVAICPYFVSSNGKNTICEVCRFKFKDIKMRDNFVRALCASFDYNSCPICKETNDYYARKERGITSEDEFEEII